MKDRSFAGPLLEGVGVVWTPVAADRVGQVFGVKDHMKMLHDEMQTYVELASRSIGLEIPLEYKAGVLINLERLFQQSELFTNFSLSEEVEAATVFLA